MGTLRRALDVVAVRTLRTHDALVEHLAEVGADLPVAAGVNPGGPLARPLPVLGRDVANRFAVLPMEGWDGTADGRPTDLVRRRWRRFGASGAGLVWAEATAVRPDGRANPRQLVIDEATVDDLAALRAELVAAAVDAGHPPPLVGLQLTHSGRWSRPDGEPRPRVAYRHPLLDRRGPVDDRTVLTDAELDDLVATFVEAAGLAARAGFAYVDVKHCHGYLLHELLTGHDRPGPYGGDLDGRSRFLRLVCEGVRDRHPELGLALRLSAFDVVPHAPGDDDRGRPEAAPGDGYRLAFGGDGTGAGIDLGEPIELLRRAADWGVGLVSVTAGSPYYCPHVQRPAAFPPSDGYLPPRDPFVEVARLAAAARDVAAAVPDVAVVASGLSYAQQWLAHVAEPLVEAAPNLLAGYGRMALSYPDLPADVLAGSTLDVRRICRTLSDCTTAPRMGLVSGCYPYDPHYKALPEREVLVAAKRGDGR